MTIGIEDPGGHPLQRSLFSAFCDDCPPRRRPGSADHTAEEVVAAEELNKHVVDPRLPRPPLAFQQRVLYATRNRTQRATRTCSGNVNRILDHGHPSVATAAGAAAFTAQIGRDICTGTLSLLLL